MSDLDKLFEGALHKRQAEGSFRSLKLTDPSLIDFSSNDYLGLARSLELKTKIHQKINSIADYKNGSTGSRLLTGNTSLIEEAEQQLARLFDAEAALIFNSGYNANLAILSSIPKRGDTIIYDEKSHSSIKDALRLSVAKHISFKHNNLEDLEKKIRKSQGSLFVVVESIYSMDGDLCPLELFTSLCTKYNAHLLVDEAHSTGVYGKYGSGLVCQLGLASKIPIRVYTFGKGMGIHGACVVGSQKLRDYLINFARPFIYTTATDLYSTISITESFDYLKRNTHLQEKLSENIKTFKEATKENSGLSISECAIQSFIVPGNNQVKKAAQTLQYKGLDIRPIFSPTVAPGTERLRIIIHTYNTKTEIQMLAEALLALSSRS